MKSEDFQFESDQAARTKDLQILSQDSLTSLNSTEQEQKQKNDNDSQNSNTLQNQVTTETLIFSGAGSGGQLGLNPKYNNNSRDEALHSVGSSGDGSIEAVAGFTFSLQSQGSSGNGIKKNYQSHTLIQSNQIPITTQSPRSTPDMTSPFLQQQLTYRSPRLSPLHSNIDFRRNIDTEFPFSGTQISGKSVFKHKNRGGRDSMFSGDAFFPETINEDMKEEETPVYVRQSRFKEIRDYNEFGKEQKRYRSDDRGKRKKNPRQRIERIPQILTLPSTYVTETEDEDDSQSSKEEDKNKGKKKFITLAHFSQLINKRIFSDDFDKNLSESNSAKQQKRFGCSMSMLDQPIKEDSELEEADRYLSDSSSSSQFSLRKRYLSLDLAKLIDKLDPLDYESAVGSKYLGNVGETIEEEHSVSSDELDRDKSKSRSSFLSSQSSNTRNRRNVGQEPINPLSLQFFREKNYRTSKSLISPVEQDSIAEELEEYEFHPVSSTIDQRMHCFTVPQRLRTPSETDMSSVSVQKDLSDSSHGQSHSPNFNILKAKKMKLGSRMASGRKNHRRQVSAQLSSDLQPIQEIRNENQRDRKKNSQKNSSSSQERGSSSDTQNASLDGYIKEQDEVL